MQKEIKVILIAFMAIFVIVSISGCTTPPQKTIAKNNMTPEQVVVAFWGDLARGNYTDAYQLAYHPDVNESPNDWIAMHEMTWGVNGSNLKVYNLSTINNITINASNFEGNFSEAKIVTVNASVSYMGKNSTGITQFIVVRTENGWKLLGNY
jgi:hypothetical protein